MKILLNPENSIAKGAMRENLVFLNGGYVPAEEAKITATIPGILHGFGLFETMRWYRGKIVYLDEHIERIMQSCRGLTIKIPYSINRIRRIIQETVKLNNLENAYVKLVLWKGNVGTEVLVIAKEYSPLPKYKYAKGYSVCISSFRQNEDYFLSRIKSTNRILYELSFQEAKGKGCDEALILNTRGFIAEGTRSNIFLVKDNRIFTPGLDCGCLAGVTRKVIFDLAGKNHLEAYESRFTVYDLYKANEAFLTNSLMGVMPITSVERQKIGNGKSGKVTRLLMQSYFKLLNR